MSGSAGLFNTFFFYLVGSPKVGGAGDGKKKIRPPYNLHKTITH